jgi:hypothetical protein
MTNQVFKAKDRHGAEMEFEIKPPTRQVETEADINFRRAYAESLKFGLLPREGLRKMMRDNDIWSDKHEKELKDGIANVARLEVLLNHYETSGNKEECLKTAGDLAKSRRRMWELILIQQSAFMNSSCEAYAEMIRLESQLAASVVIKATGQRYWKDYKEYVLERDTNEIATVANNAMILANEEMTKQQTEMTENNPEQRWLKKFKLDTLETQKKAQKELRNRVEKSVGTSNKPKTKVSKTKTDNKTVRNKKLATKPAKTV